MGATPPAARRWRSSCCRARRWPSCDAAFHFAVGSLYPAAGGYTTSQRPDASIPTPAFELGCGGQTQHFASRRIRARLVLSPMPQQTTRHPLSGREPDATGLVAAAGQLDLSHATEGPRSHERGHAARGACSADLEHASEPAAARVDDVEPARARVDRVGNHRHASRAARAGDPVGAILRAAWPVLAALALCPLAAL